jgi:hypothetical protein
MAAMIEAEPGPGSVVHDRTGTVWVNTADDYTPGRANWQALHRHGHLLPDVATWTRVNEFAPLTARHINQPRPSREEPPPMATSSIHEHAAHTVSADSAPGVGWLTLAELRHLVARTATWPDDARVSPVGTHNAARIAVTRDLPLPEAGA